MSSVKIENTKTGASWLTILGVVFVLLKVFGISAVATWPWWQVLLPFYFGIAVVLAFVGGFAALALVVGAVGFIGLGIVEGCESIYRYFKRKKK